MLEMEPAAAKVVERRLGTQGQPPYRARSTDDVLDALERFFEVERPGSRVSDIRRMGGGASKEQFLFSLSGADRGDEKFVLRMDPLAAITETDRRREFELLEAMQGVVPAPRPLWLDPDGVAFGCPAVIMEFVGGVTKPTDSSLKVSGLGTLLGDRLRAIIKGQVLDHLVGIHAFDWRNADLPSFDAPDADAKQAARWALNYWKSMWQIDRYEERPIFTLTEQWLTDNIPECDELVMTHGDYRTGNYLFDEDSGQITAVLDWELARIGDYHEDLGWFLMQLFGIIENGQFRAGDLFEREEFIDAYEQASGRRVNRATLHFYDVMASWKCYIITAGNGLAAARAQHNHQDVLLTFIATTAPLFAGDLCRLLSTEVSQ